MRGGCLREDSSRRHSSRRQRKRRKEKEDLLLIFGRVQNTSRFASLEMNSISSGVTFAEGLSAGRLFAETLFAEAKKKEEGKGRPFTRFWARPKHQQICLVFFLCQHLCRGSICGEILCGGKKRETFYCFQKRMDPGSCVGDGLLGSLFSQAGVQEANEVRCDIKILCGRGVAAK